MAPDAADADEPSPEPYEGEDDGPGTQDGLRGVAFRRVTQEDDAAVNDFRNLKDRDWARKDEGLFVVEGEMCVRNLLMHGRFPVHSVLLSERRAAAMGDLLRSAACIDSGTNVLVAPQRIMDSIVGFAMQRGVLAIGRRQRQAASAAEVLQALTSSASPSLPSSPSIAAPASSVQRVVMAEHICNHDNVGALFRNAAALGASAVLFDGASVDPLYRKALRVSGGHVLAMPWCRAGTGPGLVRAAQAAGFTVAALTPAKDAVDISRWWPRPRRIAVLVGGEGPGLEEETQALADVRLQIPMAASVDSLNVATAAAVALSELRPGRRPGGGECWRGCVTS
mmetsp:Transcript_16423/g.51573  ORF Transcript_16423/g.51573 Transcript_16423/m.51573 type:complete len:338 (-) Transcript_16423:110-1123(-)